MIKIKSLLLISLSFSGVMVFSLGAVGEYGAGISLFKVISIMYLLYLVIIKTPILVTTMSSSVKISKQNTFNILIFLGLILIMLLNIKNVRLSSMANVFFFLIMFLVLFNYIKILNIYTFLKLLKIMIYIFFFITIIGIFTYMIHLNIFDFTYVFKDSKFSFPRFMGLSTEPSHAAFIVLSSYLVYIILSRSNNIKYSVNIHFIVLFLIISFQSTYGFLLYMGTFIYLFLEKFKRYKYIAFPTLLLFVIGFNDNILGYFDRLQGIYTFLTTFDYSVVDSSASVRLMPAVILLNQYSEFNLFQQLIGHGAGTSTSYILDISEGLFQAGHIASFLYDFGILGIILLFIFLYFNISRKYIFISFYFIFLLIFNAAIATQMFWWVLLMLFSVKIFDKEIEKPLSNIIVVKD